MPQVDPNDLIPIADAAKVYERSRRWLEIQVDEGRLSLVKIPGDQKNYLLKSELAVLLAPQIVKPSEQDRKSS